MYQKPDFIKVSVKANDVFAAYGSTGCPMDEMTFYTIPCDAGDPNYMETTLLGMGYSHECYTTLNA